MVHILFVCLMGAVVFISGCTGNKKRLAARMKADTLVKASTQTDVCKNESAVYNNVNKQLALFDRNISFYGKTSDREILIQQDSLLIFQSPDDTLRFLISKKTRDQNAGTVYYAGKKETGLADTLQSKKQIQLKIIESRFLEESSAMYYPFSIEITLHDVSGKQSAYFSGGGFYLAVPRMHDIWAVDSLNGAKISFDDYPNGVPVLEFHLDGGRLHGFAGCNHFSGLYYIIENQIQFSAPSSTLKMCAEMSAENSFLAMLNKQRYTYSFQANKLTLRNAAGASIILKKVD